MSAFDNGTVFPEGVTLLHAGSGTPLICVSPTGGAEGFEALFEEMPEGRPVIGLDTAHVPLETVLKEDTPAQADRFVHLLRQVLPRGPFALTGFSFGAYVAFEMARRLVEDDHPVAWLGIIDTGPSDIRGSLLAHRVKRAARIAGKVPSRAAMAWRARVPVARGAGLAMRCALSPGRVDADGVSLRERLEALRLDVLRHGRPRVPEAVAPVSDGDGAVRLAIARKVTADKRSIRAYRMAPLPVHVCLLGSTHERRPADLATLEASWRRLARGGLTVHWFEGGHLDLVRRPLAAEVGRVMARDLAATLE